MKPRRHNEPQFDLPVIGDEFNLRAEQTADGERIARERRQAEANRADTEQRQQGLDYGFGELIAVYSREQAIEDGELVDVSQCLNPCPFKYPVAMTRAAYEATIAAGGTWEASDGSETLRLPNGQDVEGRFHDVCQMLLATMKNPRLDARQRRNSSRDRVYFSVVVDTHGNGRKTKVELWSLCGPGDDAAPVITIMLEGED